VVEKAGRGKSEWIMMDWVNFFYIDPKPNSLLRSALEIRITPKGGREVYPRRSKAIVKRLEGMVSPNGKNLSLRGEEREQ
jgi:hypothetical protein